MTFRLFITALAMALACALAGTARAEDATTTTIVCTDATTWVLDGLSVDTLGPLLCGGDYVLLQDRGASPAPELEPPAGEFDLDPNMAPDPELYAGEVRCPDGSIWAVPIGDDFTCPELFVGVRSA